MLFNSIEFAFFLPLVFLMYWSIPNKKYRIQNVFILFSSYLFYGWWDWRFLSLIFISSICDYLIGIGLLKYQKNITRKILLLISLSINLGLLGIFKYYNFFIESFNDAFTLFGENLRIEQLKIVLPVGISFYTFQTISYTVDIYKKKFTPTRDIIAFFSFVSFFPQLVAGPIERAKNLLPQFLREREFLYNNARNGLRQMLWGLFKKIVIADNCAGYVNEIFANYQELSGMTLGLGAFLFAFQIYGDFSGYSDIAIGTAKLFGFNLKKNFAFPYFSRDIAEFWRRWHISLTTWFRDYVYIPLGGSRGGIWIKLRNTFIIFIISGFWHGANWTFIFWGILNSLYFLPLLVLGKNRNNLNIVAEGKLIPSFSDLVSILITFTITTFGWIIFRSETIGDAIHYIVILFTRIEVTAFVDDLRTLSKGYFLIYHLVIIIFLILVEWIQRTKEFALDINDLKLSKFSRISIYYILVISIIWFGGIQQEFIYFQF